MFNSVEVLAPGIEVDDRLRLDELTAGESDNYLFLFFVVCHPRKLRNLDGNERDGKSWFNTSPGLGAGDFCISVWHLVASPRLLVATHQVPSGLRLFFVARSPPSRSVLNNYKFSPV